MKLCYLQFTALGVLFFVAGFARAEPDREMRFDFELVGAEQYVVTPAEFRGSYVLAGFGFTTCRHICPAMVANMARVLNGGGEDVHGLFISVDNERDTPEKVAAYASGFSERITGVTGSYRQIAAAANNMNISFAVTKSQDNFTVAHTSHLLLFGPEGQFIDSFSMNTASADIIGAIATYPGR